MDSRASGNCGEGRRLPHPTIAAPPSSFLSPVAPSPFPGKRIHQPRPQGGPSPWRGQHGEPLATDAWGRGDRYAPWIPVQAGTVGRGGGFPTRPLPPHLPPSSVLSRLRHSRAGASILPSPSPDPPTLNKGTRKRRGSPTFHLPPSPFPRPSFRQASPNPRPEPDDSPRVSWSGTGVAYAECTSRGVAGRRPRCGIPAAESTVSRSGKRDVRPKLSGRVTG